MKTKQKKRQIDLPKIPDIPTLPTDKEPRTMATAADIQDVADACVTIANALKKIRGDTDQVLNNNSAHSIDWTSQAAEDALADKPYTKEQINNLIAAFAAINTNIWDTFHGTNIEVVTTPIV